MKGFQNGFFGEFVLFNDSAILRDLGFSRIYVHGCHTCAYMMLRVDVWSNIGLQDVILPEPRVYSYFSKWPIPCYFTYLTNLISASYFTPIRLFDLFVHIWPFRAYLDYLMVCPTSTGVPIFESIMPSQLRCKTYYTLNVPYLTYLGIFDSSVISSYFAILWHIWLNDSLEGSTLWWIDIVLKPLLVEGGLLDILSLFDLLSYYHVTWYLTSMCLSIVFTCLD